MKVGGSVIVYDDVRVSQIKPEMFSPDYWSNADTVPGYSGGRGATLFVQHQDADWVLRHYHRGGVIGKLLRDQFVWLGSDNTRPFLEWDLLAEMHAAGLPCPAPVAARYVRTGLRYTADLITVRLPDVVPFSTRLEQGRVAPAVWAEVGHCIGAFHVAGYFHAHLSTHNLQIDTEDRIYLLDFDRGARRSPGNWRQRNLERLHRSCVKISREGVLFEASDWDALLAAYRESCP